MKLFFAFHLTLVLMLCSCNSARELASNSFKDRHHPVSQLWEKKTANGWEPFEIVNFTYNAAKLPVNDIAKTIKEDTLIFKSRILRSYDKNGNMTSSKRELWKENQWTDIIRSRYTSKANKIIQRVDSIKRNDVFNVITTAYEYDRRHRLLSEVSFKKLKNEKIRHSKITYVYNNKNQVLEKTFPVWTNGEWAANRKMILQYDKQGNHIRTTRFNWENGDWIESIDYELQVDHTGRRISELWKRKDDKQLKKDYLRVTYQYSN